ncbi:hypothetical protein DXG01_010585 [Tephrocybe rancida]|nr:hypothetical protein DXG01_010585 [Tephrocybe rancida]
MSAGVANYIQSKLFSPKLWIPPFFTPLTPNKADDDVGSFEPPTPVLDYSKSVQDAAEQSSKKKKKKKRRKRGSDERAQWLGDKAKAMLAAGYLTGGQETALQVAKALGIPILGINTWADFAAKGVAAPLNLSLKRESTEGVEAIIGYKVAQPRLLAQALTHSSVVGHDSTFTERLEFIGDAILDFMVIRHLYDREQQLTPGGLTLLKGAMVSNSTLAAVCVCSGLYKHFYHKSHPLQTSIRDYVAKLEISRDKEYQNAESEGRLPGQFWLEIAIPKALSDIVESVMGAVYVGDNFSLEGVEKLFENLLKPFYDKHITLKTLSHHPTKLLFELFQSQGCRRFTVQNDGKGKKTTPNIVQVVVHDITLASAEDPDPGLAARRASLFALDALEGDPGFFARTCDCRINTMAKDKGPSRSAEQMEAEDNESEDGRVANEPVAAEILQESDIEEGMIVE